MSLTHKWLLGLAIFALLLGGLIELLTFYVEHYELQLDSVSPQECISVRTSSVWDHPVLLIENHCDRPLEIDFSQSTYALWNASWARVYGFQVDNPTCRHGISAGADHCEASDLVPDEYRNCEVTCSNAIIPQDKTVRLEPIVGEFNLVGDGLHIKGNLATRVERVFFPVGV